MHRYLKPLSLAFIIALQACSAIPSQSSLADVVGVENMSQAVEDLRNPQKQEEFTKKIKQVAHEISKDSTYIRIPLDTPEQQEWFTARAFLLWDGQITAGQFIQFGLERFPRYEASFTKVASILNTQY